MRGVYSIVFLVLATLTTSSSAAQPLEKVPRLSSEERLDTTRRDLQSSISSFTPTYSTEAFECDEINYPIPFAGPKKLGESIRICIQPARITRERGVVMRSINNFTFDSPAITQEVVLNGGREGSGTIISCVAGEDICVFRTILEDYHFVEDGNVTGFGEIYLEYVTAEVAEQNNPLRRRNLRRTQSSTTTSDILFAGAWPVDLIFKVQQGDVQLPQEKLTISDWWAGLSPVIRNTLFAIATLCLICIASCVGYGCCKMIKYEMDEGNYVDGEFPRDVDVNSRASFFDYFQKDFESTASEEHSYISSLEEGSSEDGSYTSVEEEEEDKFDDELSVESEIEKCNGPPRAIGVKRPKRRPPPPHQQEQPSQRANAVPKGRPNPGRKQPAKAITPKKPQSERSEYGESSSSETPPTASMSSEPSSKGSQVPRSSPKKVARKVPPPKRVARNVVKKKSSEPSEESSAAGEPVDDIPMKPSRKQSLRKVPLPKKSSRQVAEVLEESSDEESLEKKSLAEEQQKKLGFKKVPRHAAREEVDVLHEGSSSESSSSIFVAEELVDEIPKIPMQKRISRDAIEVIEDSSEENSRDKIPVKQASKKAARKVPPPKKSSRQVAEVLEESSDEESSEKKSLAEEQQKKLGFKKVPRHAAREEVDVLHEDSSSESSSSSSVAEELVDEIPKIPMQKRVSREAIEVLEDSPVDSSRDKKASAAYESVGDIPVKQSPKKVPVRKVPPKRPARKVAEVLEESPEEESLAEEQPKKPAFKRVSRHAAREEVDALHEDSSSESSSSSAAEELVDDILKTPIQKRVSREAIEVLKKSSVDNSRDKMPVKQAPPKKKPNPERRVKRVSAPTKKGC